MFKKFIEEFKAFALRGNVIDMSVGVIIGGAFTNIVTAVTDNLVTPILNFLTGAEHYEFADVAGFANNLVGSIVNFAIMAFILFCILKAMNAALLLGKKAIEKKEEEAPTTKTCPFCKSTIAIEAVRCPNCTSILDEAAFKAQEKAE